MLTKFILIGTRADFTGELAGYQFRNGVTHVPAADADKHRLILSRYYAAYPVHEFVTTQNGLRHLSELGTVPAEANTAPQVPVEANGESFGSDDLDESLPAGVTE